MFTKEFCQQRMQSIVDGAKNGVLSAEEQTEFNEWKAYLKQVMPILNTEGKPVSQDILNNSSLGGIADGCVQTGRRPKNSIGLKCFSDRKKAHDFLNFIAAIGGNRTSEQYLANQGINIAAVHGEGDNLSGGYLVPQQFSTDIINLRNEYGVFRRNTKNVPMTGDTLLVPRRVSGLTTHYVGESTPITESTKSWGQVELKLRKAGILTRFSSELASDAVISIADDLADEIAYAFAMGEDQAGFNGDGDSDYGHMTGVCPKLLDINGVDDGGGLYLASGNDFADITLADLNGLVSILPAYALRRAKWYCSSRFYFATMTRLLTAAGGNQLKDIENGFSRAFLGYPVELPEVMPSTDANSQIVCLFGDLAQASTMGTQDGIRIESSNSAVVSSQSTFERDQIAVRGIQRFDIVVHDVGTSTTAGPVVGLISANS